MKLTCPSCGAVHSAEAWMNDAAARQCLLAIAGLDAGIARRILPYLALFRPGSGNTPQSPLEGGFEGGVRPPRGLSWSRALSLLSELSGLVGAGWIQWEGKVARPAPAAVWGQAMDRMIECPPKRLPLKSHGYLKSIVYEIADETDRSNERSKTALERSNALRSKTGADAEPERISREELRKIREQNLRRGRRANE